MTERDDLVGIANFLAQTRLLSTLAFNQLLFLAANVATYQCNAGDTIFRKDDEGSRLFIVRSGSVKIGLADTELATMYPGDIFGELSVLDGKPRSADAIALEPVQALVLERDQFVSFLRSHPDAAVRILEVVASRLRRTDKLLEEAVFSKNA